MSQPRVTVIVVNWNGRKVLRSCLHSIALQTFRDYRVIVVDNHSTDGSVSMIRARFPWVDLLTLGENVGFAAANNRAVAMTSSPYLALVNNDLVLHPRWLQSMVDALDSNPSAGAAACKMVFYHRPDRIDRAGDAYTIVGAAWLRGRGDRPGRWSRREEIFGACAGGALFRRRAWLDVGGFDEDFFLVYEDVDLNFRLQLAGYRCVYIPEALAFHRASFTVGDDSDISVYYGHRNLEWVFVKNLPVPHLLACLFPHLFYDFFSMVFFLSVGKAGVFLRAKLDAVRSVPRILQKRRCVQSTRRVTNAYVWSLMSGPKLTQRLARRLKRK